jgi:hypothetical protein
MICDCRTFGDATIIEGVRKQLFLPSVKDLSNLPEPDEMA